MLKKSWHVLNIILICFLKVAERRNRWVADCEAKDAMLGQLVGRLLNFSPADRPSARQLCKDLADYTVPTSDFPKCLFPCRYIYYNCHIMTHHPCSQLNSLISTPEILPLSSSSQARAVRKVIILNNIQPPKQ